MQLQRHKRHTDCTQRTEAMSRQSAPAEFMVAATSASFMLMRMVTQARFSTNGIVRQCALGLKSVPSATVTPAHRTVATRLCVKRHTNCEQRGNSTGVDEGAGWWRCNPEDIRGGGQEDGSHTCCCHRRHASLYRMMDKQGHGLMIDNRRSTVRQHVHLTRVPGARWRGRQARLPAPQMPSGSIRRRGS